MREWYLIKTKLRQEKTAVQNLCNQNYSVYFPSALINSKEVALFPGYIFIHIDKDIENWSSITSTKGVKNFVKFGLNYAKVPENIIDFIKSNIEITSKKIKNHNQFKTGDSVLINDGIFKNYHAIFKSFRPEDRIILLLKIMGRQQTINIKHASLTAL